MKRKSIIKSLQNISFGVLSLLSCSSCSSWLYYACAVDAYGTMPENKSYYLILSDSLMANDFRYREHVQSLKNTLSNIGYQEVPITDAVLCIDFDFIVGDIEYGGTVTTSYSSSLQQQNTNASIANTAKANVNGSASKYGNSVSAQATVNGTSKTNIKNSAYTLNTGWGSSYSSANYNIPIKFVVNAYDAKTMSPVWQIGVSDYLRHDAKDDIKLRICVPWMLAAAQEYIGQNRSVPRVELKHKGDVLKKYGLTWNELLFDGFSTML